MSGDAETGADGQAQQIDVKILGRDYRLVVKPDERARLLDAAKVVDDKMKSIRDAGKIAGIDRIAVMAALQLAHELLGDKHPKAGTPSARALDKIKKMSAELDQELKRQEQLF